ncbi:MAG: S41 family peptidase [Flavobacteriales bacterium]
MKSKLLLSTLFIGVSSLVFSQQVTSSISNEALSTYNYVWGFLKYHTEYPKTINWDRVLLKDYASVKEYSTEQQIQQKIDSLFAICGVNDKVGSVENYDLEMSWLNSSQLSEDQKLKVIAIANTKLKFKQKYVGQTRGGRLTIKEQGDTSKFTDNESMRYLGLCRYWNVINYWSPYRDLIRDDWNQSFKTLLPEFQSASDEEKYYFALLKLSSATDDGHAMVMMINNAHYNSVKYLPFLISWVDGHTYVRYATDSFLNQNNILLKDEILEIDGVTSEARWDFVADHFRGSNDEYKHLGAYLFAFTNAEQFELKIRRNGEILTRIINSVSNVENKQLYESYAKLNTKKWEAVEMQGKKFLYVDMGELNQKDINREFRKALKNADNIVFDIRNYPHGTMYKLNRLLFNKRTPFAQFTIMNLDDPGSFKNSKPVRTTKRRDFEGKIFVLCNGASISHAEFNIMSLQAHPNTTVIGSRTAGADGDVAFVRMPYDNIMMFSSIGVFYPDGRPTQQVGVKIDFEIPDSITHLPLSEDPHIQKALELMQ